MKLPPLNALRAFEVAARHGSFAKAAREIGVSSAAVSQQVRKLEAYLGHRLFFRNNNQIELTDAGRDLYSNAAAALGQISTFTATFLRPVGPRPLVVSALPSLAERWVPKLVAQLPDLAIQIRAEDDPVDLMGQGVDLRLCYGATAYHGFWSTPIFQDYVAPVASREQAEAWRAAGEDLGSVRLIEMDWGPSFSRTPKWADWCLAAGRLPPTTPKLTVPGATTALSLAEQGVGVALGHLHLAQEALRQGRLVQLSDVVLPLPHPYQAVTAHAHLRRKRVQAVLQVLEKIM